MLTMDRVYDAQKTLEGVAERTVMLSAGRLSEAADGVLIKAENLQRTGSFKLRGAYYRISRLSEEEKARGVIACSAGNHAQGVALAASREGLRCVICMPESTPLSKVERTRAYGAEVVLVPGVYDDAYARAVELQEEQGYTLVHPFDDPDIIAGQATVGLELLEQAPDAEVVLVPVGGGGLIAGIAYVVKQLRPSCQVIGVEAQNAASMKRSLERGERFTLDSAATIADGIAVKRVGEEPFRLCQQYVDGVVTVKEGEIASAILRMLEDYKLVCEGAGAVAVAAAMYGRVDLRGKKAVCVVSGGNVDPNVIAQIINKGLIKTGRVMQVETVLEDKPDRLKGLLDILAQNGGNVLNIHHDREDIRLDVGSCRVQVSLETKGHQHAASIREALRRCGYEVAGE